MRSSLLILVALLGIVTLTRAFITPIASSSLRRRNDSSLAFWGKKQAPKQPPKQQPKDDKKKTNPFVFVYGKPQYNWVTGEKSFTAAKKKNWLVKPDK